MEGTDALWEEHRSLRRRRRELEAQLERLAREEASLEEELERVEEQVAYYGSLAKEMKKALDPPRLDGLLRSLRRR